MNSFDSRGERITWVHLKGPECNLFVVAVYLDHREKTAPTQDQTLAQLQQLLSEILTRDCIYLLDDFNEQLAANVQGVTDNWTDNVTPTKHSEQLLLSLGCTTWL